ncbi:hypothetical protein VNO78_35162 [Psophocarpus tetragonolobus]|uniref:Uncharacterized protein n=1 Tax=Psophocarpus tetragonolobus TaxID=3891 RepID=A0AAN9NSP3_PSOTE
MAEREEIYHQYDDGNGNQKHDRPGSKIIKPSVTVVTGKDRKVPYRDNRHSQRILRALGIPLLCVFLVAGTEQQGKTRPTCPGLEGELYLRENGE